jgi:hypothetical protein
MTAATGFEAKPFIGCLRSIQRPAVSSAARKTRSIATCWWSMLVDVMLMQALVKAVPDHAALLIVGEIDRLPSVGIYRLVELSRGAVGGAADELCRSRTASAGRWYRRFAFESSQLCRNRSANLARNPGLWMTRSAGTKAVAVVIGMQD